ncbi:MAG: hypothetical protein ABIT76_03740 [Chthoniobacterales bacterium]
MAEAEHYNHRLKQLSDRAAASRHSLAHAGRSLAASANVSRRLQTSIRGNLTTWLGSAALVGLVLAKLPARKKKIYIKAGASKGTKAEAESAGKAKGGLAIALLGLVFQAVRPHLQKLITEQIRAQIEKRRASQRVAATGVSPAIVP